MKYCHSCGAQFADSFKRCIHCNRKIHGGSPSGPSAHAPTPSRSELHRLCSRQPPFISRLAARLKGAGIQPFIQADPGADRVDIHRGIVPRNNWASPFGAVYSASLGDDSTTDDTGDLHTILSVGRFCQAPRVRLKAPTWLQGPASRPSRKPGVRFRVQPLCRHRCRLTVRDAARPSHRCQI